jgi:hypothetical protein
MAAIMCRMTCLSMHTSDNILDSLGRRCTLSMARYIEAIGKNESVYAHSLVARRKKREEVCTKARGSAESTGFKTK